MTAPPQTFPTPLELFPALPDAGLLAVLAERARLAPFNLVATGIFFAAILHTFAVKRFLTAAHHVQHRHEERARAAGRPATPSVGAEVLHFLGEIEAVFGLWAVVLLGAITIHAGWDTARTYVGHTVDYTEALFVFVIMALASSRPVVVFAETALRRVANLGRATPTAWWLAILSVGPLLGAAITEPAAMTICALLLARQFYACRPSRRLAYATLGLLFVNVSVGGTLTHFAAPPVLMVARAWHWDLAFMLGTFGWRAVLGIGAANLVYFALFRRELSVLRGAPTGDAVATPAWVVASHLGFIAWTVLNAHYPVLFLGGFLFFLGFAKATGPHQAPIELGAPLLVAFFLAGLVVHGGLQGWWIAPVLGRLSSTPLFVGAVGLTAFNDNALVTYLATLVPDLDAARRFAVVAGAVAGGGLTVIANAPNPAGQAILASHFEGGISPLGLAAGALLPTLIVGACLMLPG